MFTGLIEDVGSVQEIRRGAEGMVLKVATALSMDEIGIGDSVAVNGACLTVTARGAGSFLADVSPESLERTTLGGLAVGARVNLERALRLCDRLGGHLVSGHIDCQATVRERRSDGNAVRFAFRMEGPVLRFVVEKGSICIDGISLTVNEVGRDGFSVAIIPHTLGRTTLEERRVGDRVNIETDLLGKYVERLLEGRGGSREGGRIDLELLAKHGFL